jgi:hypothetical protein
MQIQNDPALGPLHNSPEFRALFITSYQATRIFKGISADQFCHFRYRGLIDGHPVKKGSRTIFLYDLFQILVFLLSEPAGKFRAPIETYNVAELVRDPRLQFRPPFLDSGVDDLVRAIQVGDKLPPLVAFSIDGRPHLVDGWRRLRAHELAVVPEVKVQVLPGGIDEATLFAARCNQAHGKRFGRGEQAAVVKIVSEDPSKLAHVIDGSLTHRKFARYYGFTETSTYLAFRKLIEEEQMKKGSGSGQPDATSALETPIDLAERSPAVVRAVNQYLRIRKTLEARLGLNGDALEAKIIEIRGKAKAE